MYLPICAPSHEFLQHVMLDALATTVITQIVDISGGCHLYQQPNISLLAHQVSCCGIKLTVKQSVRYKIHTPS